MIFILIILLYLFGIKAKTPRMIQSQYLSISLDKDEPFEPIGNANYRIGQPALAVSPDGSNLVYVAREGVNTKLFKRPLDKFEAEPLAGTEGAFYPFFSPDGKWVGFFTKNELKKVSINGRNVVKITNVTNPYGIDWGMDDKIIISQRQGSLLSLVDASNGNLIMDYDISGSGISGGFPDILPGGEAVICSDFWARKGIYAIILSSSEKIEVLRYGTHARYIPGGYLVFVREGVVHLAEFDKNKLKITGPAIPILDNVRIESTTGAVQMDFSDNGTLVYAAGKSLLESNFVWKYRTGKEEYVDIPRAEYGHFQLSPDGDKLVVVIYGRIPEIYTYDFTKGIRSILTSEGDNKRPIWSPDSKSIIYKSKIENKFKIISKSILEQEKEKVLLEKDERINPIFLSLDGNYLTFDRSRGLYRINLKDNNISLLIEDNFQKILASLSRDGNYLTYLSDESGKFEVYVRPFPEADKKWQISLDGGDPSIWSKNRDELFYRNDSKFYVVSYTTEPEFKPSSPKLLFKGDYLNIAGMEFDVSPDGQKFLLLKSVDEDFDPSKLNVITNWFEELKEKMAAAK
jgi:serine/threonine-protein kinase